MLLLIMVVLLLLALFGGGWGARRYGAAGFAPLGILIVLLLIFWLSGDLVV
ncbi:MAG: DUF3309 domain-containing protein [Thermomicrobiales bacterium]|nr:DUF3309 domain-containing protein [Thermomicrobiales bacterium]